MYWKGIYVPWICSPDIASDSITLYSIYMAPARGMMRNKRGVYSQAYETSVFTS